MTSEDDFRRILAVDPTDVHTRLVLADWLDDARRHREACVQRIAAEPDNSQYRLDWAAHLDLMGEHAHARFIRCVLALTEHGLSTGESYPPAIHEEAIRAVTCPACGGRPPQFPLQRGPGTFPACAECNHTGDIGGLTQKTTSETDFTVHWRRGCPERVECRLSDVVELKAVTHLGTMIGDEGWTVTDWARRVCRWHPVLELWPTDKATDVLLYSTGQSNRYCWYLGSRNPRHPYQHCLPEIVFDALRDYDDIRDGVKIYNADNDGAHLALARALAHLARA